MFAGIVSSTPRNRVVLVLLLAVSALTGANAQGLDSVSKGRAKDMLNSVKKTIKSDYFDAKYGGVDLDAHFKEAEAKIDKATSMGQAIGIIAQSVIDFNDSHLLFYPPSLTVSAEYGWRMQAIDNKIYVVAVKPNSDAEKMGLKPGDEIVSLEGFKPSRKELWKMQYYFNVISPRKGLNLHVISPGSTEEKTLNIPAKLTRSRAVESVEDFILDAERSGSGGYTHRFTHVGSVMLWKMPSFVLEPEEVDSIMRDRVGSAPGLILDLRGNGGGHVVALERLAGYFVDKDTKIADLTGRKEMKPQMAKTMGPKAFHGKLVVLIDADSGSAAEIFARFIQLQNRGTVLGDQSAGAVMQSRSVDMKIGTESIILYGMNVTNADVIMSDGVSLEHKGVTPTPVILKTPEDLAAGRDPVMSAALKLLGVEMSPADAGKLFPFDWKIDQ